MGLVERSNLMKKENVASQVYGHQIRPIEFGDPAVPSDMFAQVKLQIGQAAEVKIVRRSGRCSFCPADPDSCNLRCNG